MLDIEYRDDYRSKKVCLGRRKKKHKNDGCFNQKKSSQKKYVRDVIQQCYKNSSMHAQTLILASLLHKVVEGVTEEEFAQQKAAQEAERKAFEEVHVSMNIAQ